MNGIDAADLFTLERRVQEAFADQGTLSCMVEGFRPRCGQTEMAMAVAQTIQHGGSLVVEAGTGVGKTFAYVVPALLSGKRVLLSTATKTLQDQLFSRDLPRLVAALGVPVRLALLKGRSSYLCSHRLALARHDSQLAGAAAWSALASVELWAHTTRSGDLAELPGLDERCLPWVTSTRENCLGVSCPSFSTCHVQQARKEALAADVVVINHHLFFADMAVRESGVAELLPTVQVVVFDEAHQLNETGVQFLGMHLGTGQVLDVVRDMLAAGLQWARGLVDWVGMTGTTEQAVRELRLVAGHVAVGTKLPWIELTPQGVNADAWRAALACLHRVCLEAMQALQTVSEIAPDFTRLYERLLELATRIERFAKPCDEGAVRWLDVGMQLRMVESPLDIAHTVQTRLLQNHPHADVLQPSESSTPADKMSTSPQGRAWIFTSATLGSDAKLSWFTEPCGLTQAQILRVSSPFDYAAQAALYVPEHLPKPSDPGHSTQLALWVAQAAGRLGGRTLVLTTSLRALRVIGDVLAKHFDGTGQIDVLQQGQWPKRRLLERFRQGGAKGALGCILVASVSLWEGVDIPGDALQLLVIDKLPFPPPHDPVVEARSQRLERAGRSAFSAYSMPEAAVALKQGAGRLIRSETDRGVLVIGDRRLTQMPYGKRLLAALPPMRLLRSQTEFDAELDSLTTSSTTDLPWL